MLVALVLGVLVASVPHGKAAPTKLGSPKVLEASDLAAYDVTRTPAGQRYVREAVSRLNTTFGLSKRADDMRVLDLLGDGTEILVVPIHTDAVYVAPVVNLDGRHRIDVAIATVPHLPNTSTGDIGAASGSWNLVATECFSRWESNSVWIDHCYKLNKFSEAVRSGSLVATPPASAGATASPSR